MLNFRREFLNINEIPAGIPGNLFHFISFFISGTRPIESRTDRYIQKIDYTHTASVIQRSIVSTFLRPVYRAPDLFTSASEDAYFGKKHLGTVDVFVVCTWYEYGPRAVYCPAAYVRIVIREAILRPYFVQPLLCMSH